MFNLDGQAGSRINIHPGEWYFGGEYEYVYTVLGSCVALTAWHPRLKLGGMCHYVLPGSVAQVRSSQKKDDADGRYAQSALFFMKQSMSYYAALNEYQLGLYGGSDALLHLNLHSGVGKQNIDYAQKWLRNEGLNLVQMDVGKTVSRSITLHLASGHVSVKRYDMDTN